VIIHRLYFYNDSYGMIGDCIACTITDRTSYSLTSWESSPLCIPQLYESNIYSPPRRTFCTKEVVNHDLFLLGTQTDFNGSQAAFHISQPLLSLPNPS
jgi:hypothetical protein